MRKLICLIAAFGIAAAPAFAEMSNIDKAETRFVVSGPNRLSIQKIFYDKDGGEVIVEHNEIGLPRVLTDIAILNARKAQLQDVTWIREQVSGIDTAIANLEIKKQLLIDSVNVQ